MANTYVDIGEFRYYIRADYVAPNVELLIEVILRDTSVGTSPPLSYREWKATLYREWTGINSEVVATREGYVEVGSKSSRTFTNIKATDARLSMEVEFYTPFVGDIQKSIKFYIT